MSSRYSLNFLPTNCDLYTGFVMSPLFMSVQFMSTKCPPPSPQRPWSISSTHSCSSVIASPPYRPPSRASDPTPRCSRRLTPWCVPLLPVVRSLILCVPARTDRLHLPLLILGTHILKVRCPCNGSWYWGVSAPWSSQPQWSSQGPPNLFVQFFLSG